MRRALAFPGSLPDTGLVTKDPEYAERLPELSGFRVTFGCPARVSLRPSNPIEDTYPRLCIRQSCSVHQTTSTPVATAWDRCPAIEPMPSLNDACRCIAIETTDRGEARSATVGERRLRTQDAGRGAEGDDAGAPGQERPARDLSPRVAP